MRKLTGVVLLVVTVVLVLNSFEALAAPKLRYQLEYQGQVLAVFEQVEGLILGSSPHKPGKIALFTGKVSEAFLPWYRNVLKNRTKIRGMSLAVIELNGSVRERWDMSNAWPSKYTGPVLNAKGNDVSVETIEIVHEGVSLVDDDDD